MADAKGLRGNEAYMRTSLWYSYSRRRARPYSPDFTQEDHARQCYTILLILSSHAATEVSVGNL